MHKIIRLSALLLIPLLMSCAGMGPKHGGDPGKYRAKVSRYEFDVPVVLNEHTAAWIEFFQGRGRKHFARHLERSYRYIPAMRKILKQYGLPQDLVYIALIESGFSAKARSHANAVGFWQFISATGRRYNLKINRYVDERRDFEKATHAAARYLKDLHGMFGHWYLAAAGYNAGEGKIMRAIKRYKTKDFWEIRQGDYLRRETKDYIPKYLAAMIIAKHPERFGFTNLVPQEPLEYETIAVQGNPVDLRVAAKLINRDKAELETLNPELLMPITPSDRKFYTLRIPKEDASRFRSRFRSLPKHMRMAHKEHTVRHGESLQSVAKHHNVSPQYLALANGISEKSRLKPGQEIGIPYKPPRSSWRYSGSGKLRYHKVKSGESLWTIARKYNVPLKKLKAWNKGKIGRYLKPGQKIALRGGKKVKSSGSSKSYASKGSSKPRSGKTITYRVKDGDSLWSIASAHGVTVSELKAWNKGKIGKYLKKRQKIVIKGTGGSSAKSTQVAKAAPAASSKGRASSGSGNYRVQSGDSLWTIAQKHRVSVSQLKEWNKGNLGRHLKPGQRIKIVKASPAPARKNKPVAAVAKAPAEKAPVTPAISTVTKKKTLFHTISSGDTLWDIARKYGVRTSDIKKWNGIDQVKRLRPGDKLKIYVKKSSGSRDA